MKNSFEAFDTSNIDIERAFLRAQEALKINAIHESDFKDLYGTERLERDRLEIQRIESSPEYEYKPQKKGGCLLFSKASSMNRRRRTNGWEVTQERFGQLIMTT